MHSAQTHDMGFDEADLLLYDCSCLLGAQSAKVSLLMGRPPLLVGTPAVPTVCSGRQACHISSVSGIVAGSSLPH
jgi:hypothetical protein